MAVSHQLPEGNQDRNHCHQKDIFWLVLAVFLCFGLSFELVWFIRENREYYGHFRGILRLF